ncbi:stress-responsive transcription factor hsf1 [Puccinia graminis f. sp. tritici]|nr:stress-responsive transcription factor hsf1 [Puccinia graminis f. sp. tritici]
MVNDPNTDHLIKWSEPNGDPFFVVSSERFGRELLPKFFKHSNFGSPLLLTNALILTGHSSTQ